MCSHSIRPTTYCITPMGVASKAVLESSCGLLYSGPFLGKMFLLPVDSHSKWIEIHITNASTTAVTIEKLQLTFSSLDFRRSSSQTMVHHFPAVSLQTMSRPVESSVRMTATYHPASHGLAERAIQTIKACLKKLSYSSLQDRVNSFLFKYHTTINNSCFTCRTVDETQAAHSFRFTCSRHWEECEEETKLTEIFLCPPYQR